MEMFEINDQVKINDFFENDADNLEVIVSMEDPVLYLISHCGDVNYILCESTESYGDYPEIYAGTAEECAEWIS